jgi:hypothetical protein
MIGGYEILSRRQPDGVSGREASLSPIEALRGLRAALSDAFAARAKAVHDAPAERELRTAGAGRAAGEERRKAQRRKAHVPILLDTRTYARRREDRDREPYPAINVEV